MSILAALIKNKNLKVDQEIARGENTKKTSLEKT